MNEKKVKSHARSQLTVGMCLSDDQEGFGVSYFFKQMLGVNCLNVRESEEQGYETPNFSRRLSFLKVGRAMKTSKVA